MRIEGWPIYCISVSMSVYSLSPTTLLGEPFDRAAHLGWHEEGVR